MTFNVMIFDSEAKGKFQVRLKLESGLIKKVLRYTLLTVIQLLCLQVSLLSGMELAGFSILIPLAIPPK